MRAYFNNKGTNDRNKRSLIESIDAFQVKGEKREVKEAAT